MKSTVLRFVPLVAVAMIACGCAQKLTCERFETIQAGDCPEVVKATLGHPTMTSSNGETWVYQDDDRNINAAVHFKDGKVITKKWGDEQGIKGDTTISQPGESHEVHMREIK